MNVVKAESRHIDKISQSLTQHFQRINHNAGYNKFNTNEVSIRSVVAERIDGNSSQFLYYVLETSDGEFAGFVNTMILTNIGQILALLLQPEFEDLENTNKLFSFAIEDFQSKGLSKIYTEVTKDQPHLMSLVEESGADVVSRDIVFNL